jgi:hypothetical protein
MLHLAGAAAPLPAPLPWRVGAGASVPEDHEAMIFVDDTSERQKS